MQRVSISQEHAASCACGPAGAVLPGGGLARWLCQVLLLLLSHFSHVRLCETPQTAAHQALLSLGFSRQEHWSGLPLPSPGGTLIPW